MGKGWGVDGCKGGWKDGLFGRFTNFPLGQTGQTGQSLSKNVAVAWGVPLKTGREKAPKCTKGL